MGYMITPWIVGVGPKGITGPTTPAWPGPTVAGRDWKYAIVTDSYETVGIFPNQDDGYGGQIEGSGETNAKLFAAAPDLLDALKAAEEYMSHRVTETSEPYPLQRARAAIRKATGGL